MTIKYFILTVFVTLLLAMAQVIVKLGLNRIGGFHISFKSFFSDIIPFISSYCLWIGFITIIVSSFLWMKVLAKVELSVAYPLISISYIFGIIAAVIIFKESVPLIRWVGVIVIMFGIFLITRN